MEQVVGTINKEHANKLIEYYWNSLALKTTHKEITLDQESYMQLRSKYADTNKPLTFKLDSCDVTVKYDKNQYSVIVKGKADQVHKAHYDFMNSFKNYTQKYYIYNNRIVTTITSDHQTLFNLHQISDILGYAKSNYLATYYGSRYSVYLETHCNGTYTDADGLKEILNRGRKPGCKDLLEQLGLNNASKVQSLEADVLEQVIDYIKELDDKLDYKLQYPIGKYKIDMYVPKFNLAIEVDEMGHSDRDPVYEKQREDYIKQNLTTKLLRINPNAPKFRMAKILGSLSTMIMC